MTEHIFTRLCYTVVNGVADVQLGHEDGSSRADGETAKDLAELASVLAESDTVRAVLLRARGRDFTYGGDIELFASLSDRGLADRLRRMLDDFSSAIQRFAELNIPIVAAVRGAAAGGGLGFVCMADVVLAAEGATFSAGSSAIGLSVDGSTSWYLPRLVGLRRAQELVLLNRRLTAQEALEWGLVTRVVPDADIDREGVQVAERLALGATAALGESRRLLLDAMHTPLSEQLRAERSALVRTASTKDAAEGIDAFVQGRKPRFHGA